MVFDLKDSFVGLFVSVNCFVLFFLFLVIFFMGVDLRHNGLHFLWAFCHLGEWGEKIWWTRHWCWNKFHHESLCMRKVFWLWEVPNDAWEFFQSVNRMMGSNNAHLEPLVTSYSCLQTWNQAGVRWFMLLYTLVLLLQWYGLQRKTIILQNTWKLINLQITVQDLKRKVQFTEKNRNVKGIEYNSEDGTNTRRKLLEDNLPYAGNCFEIDELG